MSSRCKDKICPTGKVCNPKTGRCVNSKGKVAEMIFSKSTSSSTKSKSSKMSNDFAIETLCSIIIAINESPSDDIEETIADSIIAMPTQKAIETLQFLNETPYVKPRKLKNPPPASRKRTMLEKIVDIDRIFIKSQDLALCEFIYDKYTSLLDFGEIGDQLDNTKWKNKLQSEKFELIKMELGFE